MTPDEHTKAIREAMKVMESKLHLMQYLIDRLDEVVNDVELEQEKVHALLAHTPDGVVH